MWGSIISSVGGLAQNPRSAARARDKDISREERDISSGLDRGDGGRVSSTTGFSSTGSLTDVSANVIERSPLVSRSRNRADIGLDSSNSFSSNSNTSSSDGWSSLSTAHPEGEGLMEKANDRDNSLLLSLGGRVSPLLNSSEDNASSNASSSCSNSNSISSSSNPLQSGGENANLDAVALSRRCSKFEEMVAKLKAALDKEKKSKEHSIKAVRETYDDEILKLKEEFVRELGFTKSVQDKELMSLRDSSDKKITDLESKLAVLRKENEDKASSLLALERKFSSEVTTLEAKNRNNLAVISDLTSKVQQSEKKMGTQDVLIEELTNKLATMEAMSLLPSTAPSVDRQYTAAEDQISNKTGDLELKAEGAPDSSALLLLAGTSSSSSNDLNAATSVGASTFNSSSNSEHTAELAVDNKDIDIRSDMDRGSDVGDSDSQHINNDNNSSSTSTSSNNSNSNSNNNSAEIERLTKTIKDLQLDMLVKQRAVDVSKKTISSLGADIATLRETITDRERSLESINIKMAEMMKTMDSTQAEIGEKDSKFRLFQSSIANNETDLRSQIVKLTNTVRERDERLVAFEEEGGLLSKKMGELEKQLKKSKGDLKDKETEISKLKDSREQLSKAIEELQEHVRKNENEANNATKTLQAVQAVSNVSADKMSKLEGELTSRNEEIASQKRALEGVWGEISEYKKSISALQAEKDDIRRQLGEGTNKVLETESSRRDIEQREAVLKATNRQLQESLQRQMGESSLREDRLREEINDMRKKWQDAISSRELVTGEISNMTAPLLRQIATLQESIRLKTDAFHQAESTLCERALKAEGAADMLEHRRKILEEHAASLKQEVEQLTARAQENKASNQANEIVIDRMKRQEVQFYEVIEELKGKLQEESCQKMAGQNSLRDAEMRFRAECQDLKDTFELTIRQQETQVAKLSSEIEHLKRDSLLSDHGTPTRHSISTSTSNSLTSLRSPNSTESPHDAPLGTLGEGRGGGGPSSMTRGSGSLLGAGGGSYALNEKIQKVLQQKEEELYTLQLQMKQLHTTRDALLSEVSYLSNRNSELEIQVKFSSSSDLQSSIGNLKKHNALLLSLLGEKEEEIEAMTSDMMEVKYLYRDEIDKLISQLTDSKRHT